MNDNSGALLRAESSQWPDKSVKILSLFPCNPCPAVWMLDAEGAYDDGTT